MKPCKACPFSRGVTPGALGGSAPEVYIGQAALPFILPCHKACDFDDPEWKDKVIDTPQCRGAAIFRANAGMLVKPPAMLLALPADRGEVFATYEEFLAHHKQITLEQAAAELRRTPVAVHAENQLARSSNKVFLPKK